jgi:cytochrome P450
MTASTQVPRLGVVPSLRFLLNPMHWAPEVYRRHGKMARVADVAGGMTLVFEPEDVRTVLTQVDTFEHLDRETMPVQLPKDSASYRLTGGLLALQNREKHRSLRRELMPAFDLKHLQNYFHLSQEPIQEYLDTLASNQLLDLNQTCHELAMNTALLTLFGLRLDPETRSLTKSIKAWMRSGFSPWTIFFPYDLPGTSFRSFLRNGEELESKLIQLFQKGPQGSESLAKVVFGDSWKQGELPPELVSRASGYMQASYETTANTLLWTLVFLNMFPETARSVSEELQRVLGDRPIQYADLSNLSLLRAVIIEAIRLLPPLSIFPRVVVQPVSLGGVDFLPGERVAYGPVLTHRLPHLFPDPCVFDPSRFQKAGNRHDAFLGFGGGPRRCPGENFGLNEVLLILGTWLRHSFPRILDGTSIEIRSLVVTTPAGPVPFKNEKGEIGMSLPARQARLKGSAMRGITAYPKS